LKYEKPTKDHNIPYLLPKSYKEGVQYDFGWFEKNFSHEATFNCNVQVCVNFKILIYTHLNNILILFIRSLEAWANGQEG